MGSITAQILLAAAIISAIATIGGALWWVTQKVLRPLAIVAEDWRGEPDRPGVPGRPGVMVQLADLRKILGEERDARRELEGRVAAVEQQLLERRRPLEASGPVIAERSYQDESEMVRLGFRP